MDAKKIIREMCLGAIAEGQRVKKAKLKTDHLEGTKASACHWVSLAQSKFGGEAGPAVDGQGNMFDITLCKTLLRNQYCIRHPFLWEGNLHRVAGGRA